MFVVFMVNQGVEVIGVMGIDILLVVLFNCLWMFWDYFSQFFVQVINLFLDVICEEFVIFLMGIIGLEVNLFEFGLELCWQVVVNYLIVDFDQFVKIIYIDVDGEYLDCKIYVVRGFFVVEEGGEGLCWCIEEICVEVFEVIVEGIIIIVFLDCYVICELVLILFLFFILVIYYYLVREKICIWVGFVVEVGDVCEVYYVVFFMGYGVLVVNLYLFFELVEDMVWCEVWVFIDFEIVIYNVYKVFGKGVFKMMSKMGVFIILLYIGVQIFEVIGLLQEFIDEYFIGMMSCIVGVGLIEIV